MLTTRLRPRPCPLCRSLSTTPPLPRDVPSPAYRYSKPPPNLPPIPTTRPFKQFKKPTLTPNDFRARPTPSPSTLIRLLLTRLPEWVRSQRLRKKLHAYGITDELSPGVLREWSNRVEEVLIGGEKEGLEAREILSQGGWDARGLIQAFEGDGSGFPKTLEGNMLRHFLTFASQHPDHLPDELRSHLKAILDITDISRQPFEGENMDARRMRRHFHLHMGPTNSGKTYNALKALAKAEKGAYAGPLRLLAHEVWERLNLGTVGGLDGVQKECNLLTGEERRIVNPEAGLLSCTVEMIPLSAPGGGHYEVVVVDEIQMMGDPQRGGSWTRAVLGVKAKEVHLCGDETTRSLLENLIPLLGDEITIHKYERLTPLTVADESLNSDWDNVQDGDCIVTFSRNNIFAVKKMVEEQAGKKCAVVYGALPPETRAEQARSFNEETGLAKVLVASDAVGMGLNLKIKRIIFETLSKYNGKTEVPLALTQVKQIAGRAGRYGMHKSVDDEASVDTSHLGGVVTTLHKVDLPILRGVLPLPLPSLQRAVLDIPHTTLVQLSYLLPPTTSFAELLEHLSDLSLLPQNTVAGAIEHKSPLADVVEQLRDKLSLSEMDLFSYCPVSTRDPQSLAIFAAIAKSYAELGIVSLEDVFSSTRLFTQLDLVEATLAVLPPLPPEMGIGKRLLVPPIVVSSIPLLETLHKSLTLYIWLSFRLDIAFPDRVHAQNYKSRVETCLTECLDRMPGLRNKKTHERTKSGDRATADWRKANVAPRGTMKMPGAKPKGIEWEERAIVQRLKNKELWRGAGFVDEKRVPGIEGGREEAEIVGEGGRVRRNDE